MLIVYDQMWYFYKICPNGALCGENLNKSVLSVFYQTPQKSTVNFLW